MGSVTDIAAYRARKHAESDVPIGAPPFVLEEPCPGCGQTRVSTMVWRAFGSSAESLPYPRIAPHFVCRDGRVLWQEITDAPIPITGWSWIYGHFEQRGERKEARGENSPQS